MQRTTPHRRVSDDIKDSIAFARAQRRATDAAAQVEALNRELSLQHADLVEKDWQLFTARATAIIAVVTTGIVLYHWLAAPVIAMAGLECRL